MVCPNNQLFLGCRHFHLNKFLVNCLNSMPLFSHVYQGWCFLERVQDGNSREKESGGVYIRDNITNKISPKIYMPRHPKRNHQIWEVVVFSMILHSLIDGINNNWAFNLALQSNSTCFKTFSAHGWTQDLWSEELSSTEL